MLKKSLLIVLVAVLLVLGLNKTAVETRRVTADTLGSVFAVRINRENINVTWMSNDYRMVLPPGVQAGIEHSARRAQQAYDLGREYLLRAVRNARQLWGGFHSSKVSPPVLDPAVLKMV